MLVSCKTVSSSDKEVIQIGYQKTGIEAQEVYSEYKGKSPRVMYNLAYSYLESDDIDKALATAIEAKKEYPRYIRFYTLEAYCYKIQNNHKDYQRVLKEILEIDSGNKEVIEMLISSLIAQNRKAEVIEYAQRLLAIDSKNTTALNALSLYLPFFQELTGYKEPKELLNDIINKLDDIDELKLEPTLQELGAFFPN